VGPSQRLFAAHEEVLCLSPFFSAALRSSYNWAESQNKQVSMPDEDPEVFSSVLEYLYKGDYYPRLLHNKRRGTWELEDACLTPNLNGEGMRGGVESTIYINHPTLGPVLKDTLIYCVAEKYSLPELKRLSLRKQGLQSGIEIATILSSARFAYANTPDSDSKLRAHYLALIIRQRSAFKKSGTMQAEMSHGGAMWFDLFVAMCNHLDDVGGAS
jgi:BTB/POZ domain